MRYERKYKVDQLSLDMVHQVIRSHPASFKKIFPDRQVNNIYFDTPGHRCYIDNVMGISHRKKVRVRWYGAKENTHAQNTLEVKIKENELGRKESQPFPSFSWSDVPKLGQQIDQLLNLGATFQPVLLNAYHRSYYGTSNGQFRITIDHRLQYLPLARVSHNFQFQWEDPDVVVELKYEQDLEEKVQMIRQYLPFRQTKSSKYVTGLSLLVND